jgi:hypothetical protein
MNLSLRIRRALGAATVAVGAAAAVPHAAAAAVTCTHPGTAMVVHLDAAYDNATIAADGGDLTVNGAGCNGASVVNADTIAVADLSGEGTNVTVDAEQGQFAPGPSPEAAGPEIELTIDMGAGQDTSPSSARSRARRSWRDHLGST